MRIIFPYAIFNPVSHHGNESNEKPSIKKMPVLVKLLDL